jgi:hypothetical protein
LVKIHTRTPENKQGHYSEYLVGQILEKFEDSDLEAWFNVDYLPTVPELDLILMQPKIGLYLIEIKGYKIDEIQKYDLSDLIVFPNKKKQHPIDQLRAGQIRLKNYFRDIMRIQNLQQMKIPFIHTSVFWPQISRDEWKKRFIDPQLQKQAKSMVFQDDLESQNKMIDRLKIGIQSPLLGVSPQIETNMEQLNNARNYLMPATPPVENDSINLEIKRPVIYSKELAAQFLPPKQYRVSFEGAPGTGKSTILREIGLLHASSGGTVLHVCFNKVLAADQRREYKVLQKKGLEYGVIDVFDEWELYKSIHPDWKAQIGDGLEKRFKVASEHVDEIIKNFQEPDSHPRALYDTILIDEAQDLSQGLFLLLNELARPKASWFIAYGPGQEIFNFNPKNPAPWLEEWLVNAERRKLRRSFRNSTRAFLMSQGFWENYPDQDKLSSWLKSKSVEVVSEQKNPELELALPKNSNDIRITRLSSNTARKESIQSILLEAIDEAKKADRGGDVLIVVSQTKKDPKAKSNYDLIIELLEELSQELELEILDLVPWENRRVTPGSESIRIAKYQNIRGLSASHVVLFDMDHLEKWCEEDSVEKRGNLRNYGYIALSRSRASTVIVLDSNDTSEISSFLQKSINSLLMLSHRRSTED